MEERGGKILTAIDFILFRFFWSRDPFQHQKQIKKVLFEM